MMSDGGFSWDTGGGVMNSGGERLSAPAEVGNYHMLVTAIETEVYNKDKQIQTDVEFELTLGVLAGSVAGTKDKVHLERFYKSKPGDSDEQKKRTQAQYNRFFVACGLVTPQQLKDGTGKLEGGLPSAIGCQLMVRLADKAGDDGKHFLRAYSNYDHVDDPKVQGMVKDNEALALLHPSRRWTPEQIKAMQEVPAQPEQSAEDPLGLL